MMTMKLLYYDDGKQDFAESSSVTVSYTQLLLSCCPVTPQEYEPPGFQVGHSPVPGQSQPGTRSVTARYQVGHSPVPGRSQPGTRSVTARYQVGHSPVPGRSQPGTRSVTARYQVGHSPVPGRSQPGTRSVTARYQVGHSPVPVLLWYIWCQVCLCFRALY